MCPTCNSHQRCGEYCRPKYFDYFGIICQNFAWQTMEIVNDNYAPCQWTTFRGALWVLSVHGAPRKTVDSVLFWPINDYFGIVPICEIMRPTGLLKRALILQERGLQCMPKQTGPPRQRKRPWQTLLQYWSKTWGSSTARHGTSSPLLGVYSLLCTWTSQPYSSISMDINSLCHSKIFTQNPIFLEKPCNIYV